MCRMMICGSIPCLHVVVCLIAHRPANAQPFGTMAAAPFGSSLILPISFAYISLMGSDGLRDASKLAILKANYMAKRLGKYYPVLYTGGQTGWLRHACLGMVQGVLEGQPAALKHPAWIALRN